MLEGKWLAESLDRVTVKKPAEVVFAKGTVAGLFRLVDVETLPDGSVREKGVIEDTFEFQVFQRSEWNAIDVGPTGRAC